MDLGVNSLSLSVADIERSKDFYETLGFKPVPDGGSVEEKWLIMENGDTKIGLFEGMLPGNIITFNPKNARAIYTKISKAEFEIVSASKTIGEERGACNFMIADPDGNRILFDQFE
ncbi:MAG: VOC family protein [Pyrinomonadaceae bacterium]|nr:VOC family protein [Pyrinomonadaceae bacterium]